MINNKPVVGIMQGDGNGIGYEVIIKALGDARILDSFTPVVYGSSKIFGFYRKLLHNVEQVDTYVISNVKDAKPRKINILNCLPDNVFVEPGKAAPEAARAAITALDAAVSDMKQGLLDVLVTGPINKRSMNKEGFGFTGHTEYL
ncbi:MAG: 4-hydroxythreonine-4-phosphate dehydrogenase PdxA [Treponema sp.]|nr:4-hydroxythreonine-4-phosphate dehydrogenase PdxA [Treponema sp.]